MRQTSRALFLAALVAFATSAVSRAQTPLPCGFWIAGELGNGSVSLSSDVASRSKGGLAMGLEGGYAFNRVFSLGLRLNGSTLENSNLQDPSKGESVSQFSAMVRVCPWPGTGIFLRGGAGSLRYTNNRPEEFGGSGTGLFLGAGYEFPLWKRLHLAPVVDLAWGKLDDVDNAPVTIRNQTSMLFG